MTPLVLPLVYKLGLLGEEAAGLKGALLTWLYKHRGAKNVCSSYRAIMLLPTLTKVLHRAYRPCLYDHVMRHAPPLLLGGKRGASAVFGSHAIRLFCKWATTNQLPACVLFADVASAYYNSVRDLTARRVDAQGCAVSTHTLPEGATAHEGLLEALRGPSAFEATGAPVWLESLAAEMHRRSWFTLRGDHVPVVTRRGSRPGSSLADIMYSSGVAQIIAMRDALRSQTTDAGCTPQVPWDGSRDLSQLQGATATTPLSDVIWADDLAECVMLSTPHKAAHQVSLEASILDEAFASQGYSLTYGPSKTAAHVLLFGEGSRSAKRALFQGKATFPVLRETEAAAALPLVCSYKHLGVLVGTSFLPELRARCAAAWASFRQGKLRAYRCRRIAVSRRGTLLASMVLPRLLFGAGAWPGLKRGEAQLFHRTVMSLYRQTLCVPRGEDQHISGATTCALLCLADPQTLLQVERLRYLRQLVQAAPDAVWALIRQDASYVGEMREALRWLYRRISTTVPLPDPLQSWSEWSQVMCTSPGRFRGWIKRASSLEALRLRAFAALQSCRRFLTSFCPEEQPEPGTAVRFSEACLPCRKAFVDRVSWACHASRLHGYRTRATELTRGVERAWCSGCGKLFANASRMKRHVFVTPECQRLWGTFHPACPLPKDPLHPSAPPFQLPGSHDAIAVEDVLPSGNCHPALLEALLGLDDSADTTAWEVIQDFIAPIDHLRCTVVAWKNHPQAQSFAAEVAENMILLLDPEVCCEVFHRPKQPSLKVDFLAPLTSPDGLALTLASLGTVASFSVEEPPLPSFVYPFDCSVPLAPALRQIEWLEASVEVVVAAVQTAASTPVRISASEAALRGLEPFTSWLCRGGLTKTADGLASF